MHRPVVHSHRFLSLLALAVLAAALAPAASAAPSFAPAVRYACPGIGELTTIAVGDINEDGLPDIVGGIGPSWDHPVFHFLGTGSAAFDTMQAAELYVPFPTSIALGRFRGTGSHLDLALTSMTQKAVWIVPGNGDATFDQALAQSYAAGLDPRHLVTGEFDGDPSLDFAVVNCNSNTVSYWPGHGDLTFSSPVCFGTGIDPGPVTHVDFNDDALPDFVLSSMTPGAVHVVPLDNASRDYYPRSDVSAPDATTNAVGDLTGDGVPDVAVSGNAQVRILENNGYGFATLRTEVYPAPGWSSAVALADLDGDDVLDLVRANTGDSTISIWVGNGDGTLGARTDLVVGEGPWALAVTDLDGDASPDIAVGCNAVPYHVTVLRNLNPVAVETPATPTRMALLPPRPNPSRGSATVVFELPAATTATARVVDAQGRAVRTLADGAPFAAGRTTLTWDGLDDAGAPVRASVYFVHLRTSDGTETSRKLELVR